MTNEILRIPKRYAARERGRVYRAEKRLLSWIVTVRRARHAVAIAIPE